MKNISATIMIPAYNAEEFIGDSLESAINQTYKGDYEILVVNDGTPDNSVEIIKDFQKKYSNIRLINHKKNQGTGYTRNTLLENSRGDVLVGLDADDTLKSKALEKILAAFHENPRTSVVYSNHEEVDEEGRLVKTMNKNEIHKHFNDIILHCHFPGHVRAFNKYFVGESRFGSNLRLSDDYDFLLKVIMKQWPDLSVGHIPETLYSYRINTSGLSKTQGEGMRLSSKEVVEKYLKSNKVYGEKSFEVVPALISEEIAYWDHIVDGKPIMKEETRKLLGEFLKR